MATAGLIQTSLIWVAYCVAVALALIIAALTAYTWQTRRERFLSVTLVAIISLGTVLATVFLLPVDIALVSATTDTALGVKKEWATPERISQILGGLRTVYYCLYTADALLCVVVIPFAYFWYEENDEIQIEEEGRTVGSRLWGAAKYTIAFVLLVVIIFLIGFFVPAANDKGSRHLDLDFFKRLLDETHAEKALTFGLGLLMTLGTLLYVVYTGSGLALLPVSFIRSAPAVSAPQLQETTASQLEQNRERQRQLEMRSAGRPEGMSAKDQREMDALTREERTLVRRERLAAEARGEGKSFLIRAWNKTCAVFRPIKLLGGVFLFLLALVIWASMLITGIDKAVNSVCKSRCGYILAHINVFQPINWLFLQTARAFPIDYVLVTLLVLLLFASSITGLATLGIRFLWIRIFAIRRGRTAPQALLIATVLLALMTLAINYAVSMLIAPQYATFGTQTYCDLPRHHPDEPASCRGRPDALKPCSERVNSSGGAGRDTDVCTPTIMSQFLNRITLNWPVFGAIDFWAQFAFLAVFLIVFVTMLFRSPSAGMMRAGGGGEDEDADAAEEDEQLDQEEGLLDSTGARAQAAWQDIMGRSAGRNKNYGSSLERAGRS